MGTAYAVWGGIGAAGTVIVGICFFGESLGAIRLLLLLGLIACIVGLKLVAH
jgi:quaternary ammonium compound-resistance protein SugE